MPLIVEARGSDTPGSKVTTWRVFALRFQAGPVTPEDLAHLRRAHDQRDREYARPLAVPALARTALMSPAHFSRQFKAVYGETPYGFLMTRRIERAKALLRRGDGVRDCAFRDPSGNQIRIANKRKD